jgi:glycosyltransferase involved in cell wall biosynthesis
VKILYIISNVDRAIAFEWIAIELAKRGFKIEFIFFGKQQPFLYARLKEFGFTTYFIEHQSKRDLLTTFLRVSFYLVRKRPDVVHTHLFEANLAGLFAAWVVRIKQRIHTRHHADYHHQYFPHAVKWDRLINYFSTQIIAISDNVKNILSRKEHVPESKIIYIPHGFDLKRFQIKASDQINALKDKFQVNSFQYPVVGVISRYMELKGIQYIIPAFKQLKQAYPHALLILANAKGPDKDKIKSQLEKELKKEDYLEIEFEEDLFSLYQLFDIFVHVPVNSTIEAFGQTYVEALASGIPSVFTLSGIAREFVINKENALVVDFKNSKEIFLAMKEILENPLLKERLITKGIKSVEKFALDNMVNELEKLYRKRSS